MPELAFSSIYSLKDINKNKGYLPIICHWRGTLHVIPQCSCVCTQWGSRFQWRNLRVPHRWRYPLVWGQLTLHSAYAGPVKRTAKLWTHWQTHIKDMCLRADSRFAPSQWEPALLCNDVSHSLGANLESALCLEPFWWKCPLVNAIYKISLMRSQLWFR